MKKVISAFLAKQSLTLLFAFLTLNVAWGQSYISVYYINADGNEILCEKAKSLPASGELTEAIYVVNENDEYVNRNLVCKRDVSIILMDGRTLTLNTPKEEDTHNPWEIIDVTKNKPSIDLQGHKLKIYGQKNQTGRLIARTGRGSAAIGGGYQKKSGDIYIYGGNVEAHGDISFGSGRNCSDRCKITITRGTVVSEGQFGESDIYINEDLIVLDGDNNMLSNLSSSTNMASEILGKWWLTVGPRGPINYIDKDGQQKSCTDYKYVKSVNQATWNSGWYVISRKNGTIPEGVVCNGDVNLIIEDDARAVIKGTANKAGIQVTDGSSLTIYRQSKYNGELEVVGGENGAGIGGGNGQQGGNITIVGGKLNVTGGANADAIGSGANGGAPHDIYVADNCNIKVGTKSADSPVPSDNIATDIAGKIHNKRYASTNAGYKLVYGDNLIVTPKIANGLKVDAGTWLNFELPYNEYMNYDGFYKEKTFKTKLASGNKYSAQMGNEPMTVYGKYIPIPSLNYVDEAGQNKVTNSYTVIEQGSNEPLTLSSTTRNGWYYLKNCLEFKQGIVCDGPIHIILDAKAEVYAIGSNNTAGIQLKGENASLTVYSQSGSTARLIARGGNNAPGISGVDGSTFSVSSIRMAAVGGSAKANGVAANINFHVQDSKCLCTSTSQEIAHTFQENVATKLAGNQYVMVRNEHPISTTYVDADGEEYKCTAVPIESVFHFGLGHATFLFEGTYVTTQAEWNDVDGYNCEGKVNLILADDTHLKISADNGSQPAFRVTGNNSFTIYGQKQQTGKLTPRAGKSGAAIGGGEGQVGCNITINGGNIEIYSSGDGACIGGGKNGDGKNITINGGKMRLLGAIEIPVIKMNPGSYPEKIRMRGYGGACIGGGKQTDGVDITINGGVISAEGCWSATSAGIGGGGEGSARNITINGGEITAIGGGELPYGEASGGAGIGGGGFGGSATNIVINGGKITAIAPGAGGGSAIGAGAGGTATKVYFGDAALVKADNNNPPQTTINHSSGSVDVAAQLADKKYTTVETLAIYTVTYGNYLTVNPNLSSGSTVLAGTELTFTASKREGYTFAGFFKDASLTQPITKGVAGLTYTTTMPSADMAVYAKYEETVPVPYTDAKGNEQTCSQYEFITSVSDTLRLTEGWYVVSGEVTLPLGVLCQGAINIILTADAKLTVAGEPKVTVYGQPTRSVRTKTNEQQTVFYYLCPEGYMFVDDASGLKFEVIANTDLLRQVKVIADESAYTNASYTIDLKVTHKEDTYDVTAIGDHAFKDASLTDLYVYWNRVTLPSGTNMGENVFEGVNPTVKLHVPYGMKPIYQALDAWKNFVIIENAPQVGDIFIVDGFEYTITSLDDVPTVTLNPCPTYAKAELTIPARVSYVGFTYDVTAIEANAFKDCTSITKVTMESIVPPILGANAFANSVQTIIVPAGSDFDYQDAQGWEAYKDLITVDVIYVDSEGVTRHLNSVKVVRDASFQMIWNAGWYIVVGEDVKLEKGVECHGDVHLILADGAKLTARGDKNYPGIQVTDGDGSFTIYGQTQQTGQLFAEGGDCGAGIGGGDYQAGRHITINGGIITATAGKSAAGIGGGRGYRSNIYYGLGSDITINGGVVTAIGGEAAYGDGYDLGGAGIGGGSQAAGENITIKGGIVNASTKGRGAGIGGGYLKNGENIYLLGGTVTAKGHAEQMGSTNMSSSAIGAGGGCTYSEIETLAPKVYVADGYVLKADDRNYPPENIISHTSVKENVAMQLAGKQYATFAMDGIPALKQESVAIIQDSAKTVKDSLATLELRQSTINILCSNIDVFVYTAMTKIEDAWKEEVILAAKQEALDLITAKWKEGQELVPIEKLRIQAINAVQDSAARSLAFIENAFIDENYKNSPVSEINKALNDAIKDIDQEKVGEQMDSRKQTAFDDFAAQVQGFLETLSDFEQNKAAAIAIADSAAQAAITKINETILDASAQSEKEAAIADVTNIANKYIAQINESDSPAFVESRKSLVVYDIEVRTQMFLSKFAFIIYLNNARQLASTAVQDSATNAKNILPTLAAEESVKTTVAAAIDAIATTATNAIYADTVETHFTRIKERAFVAIDNQMKSATQASELVIKKSESITSINQLSESAIAQINEAGTGDYLKDLKDEYIAQITDTVSATIALIQEATTISEVNIAVFHVTNRIEFLQTQGVEKVKAAVLLQETKISSCAQIQDSAAIAKAQIATVVIEEAVKTQAVTRIEARVAIMQDSIQKQTLVQWVNILTSDALHSISLYVQSVNNAAAQLVETQNADITAIQDSAAKAKVLINAAVVVDSVKAPALTTIDVTVTQAVSTIQAALAIYQFATVRESVLRTIGEQVNAVQKAASNLLSDKQQSRVRINNKVSMATFAINIASSADYVQSIQQAAIAQINATATQALNDIEATLIREDIVRITNTAMAAIETIQTQALTDIQAAVALTEAQTTALTAVQDSAIKAKLYIENAYVEVSVKTPAVAAIDNAIATAQDQIPAATTVETVNEAKQTALTLISEQVQSVREVATQLAQAKTDALQTLDGTKGTAITAILAAATIDEVQTLAEAAIETINTTAATATDDINAVLVIAAIAPIKDAAVTAIERTKTQAITDIQTAITLFETKAQALTAVQDSATKTYERIERVVIADSIKAKCIATIDTTIKVVTPSILNATTVEQVEMAKQNLFEVFDKVAQSVEQAFDLQLEQAKTNAHAAINEANTGAVEAINQTSDADYVQPIKTTAIAALTSTTEAALGAIQAATTLPEVETQADSALVTINAITSQALTDIQAAIALHEAQATMLTNIQLLVTKSKERIAQAIVDQTVKTNAIAAIEEVLATAKVTIPALTTLEEVESAGEAVCLDINDKVQSVLNAAAKVKDDAITAVTKAKEDAVYELTYASTLQEALPIRQKAIDSVATTAADSVAAIQAATTVEAILPIQQGAITSINTIKDEALTQIYALLSIETVRAEALLAVQDSGVNAQNSIKDIPVDQTVIREADNNISGAVMTAFSTIQKATTIAQIVTAKQTALETFAAQVQAVQDALVLLTQTKEEALETVTNTSELAQADINAAATEDYVQDVKQTAIESIVTKATTAIEQINGTLAIGVITSTQTNTVKAIGDIKAQALITINTTIALRNAQAAAIPAVADSAAIVKEQVGLIVVDEQTKTNAIAAIDQAATTATNTIENATSVWSVSNAEQKAYATYANQLNAVQDAADQLVLSKQNAIVSIQNKADEATTAISEVADIDAVRSIQENAIATINNTVTTATEQINGTLFVESVTYYKNEALTTIGNVKSQALSEIYAILNLIEAQTQAIKAVQDSALNTKSAIDTFVVAPSVISAAKTAIDAALATAIDQINLAQTDYDVRIAKQTAFTAFDDQLKAVKQIAVNLALAKHNALYAIQDAVNSFKNDINNSYNVDYVQPIKDTAIARVDSVGNIAIAQINASLDKTEVETIKESALAAIEAIKAKAFEDLYTETMLKPARKDALELINDRAASVKEKIKSTMIDEAIKTAAITAVDEALQTATTAINTAQTMEQIMAASSEALTTFDAQLEAVYDAYTQLTNTKSASLEAIHDTAAAAKTAINEAATREEVYALRAAAIATIVATDSAATADINATLVLAQVIAIKDSSLTVIETTKQQALADIKAVLDSIAEEEKALPKAKEKALAAVQDSAAKAFEAVKYLYVTPNVVYKAQDDLDYAESEALSSINYCSTVAEVNGVVEFAFARFAEIVAEAKSMEGESEAKIVPLYSDSTIVTPTEEDVTLTWPIEEDAATYTVIITEEGDTIYVAKFDADGRRTDMGDEEPSMAAARMARAATVTEMGYQYTVLGLEKNVQYGYKVISKTVDNSVISQNGGGFITRIDTPTGFGQKNKDKGQKTIKVMENQRILIIRDSKTYTMMGITKTDD